MSPILQSTLIFFGAGIGANLRYWLGGWAQARFGTSFPWGTLFVNVSGALLIGLFLGLQARHGWPNGWRLLVALGLLGGYTTFSAFSVETLAMLRGRRGFPRTLYSLGSVTLSLAAAWAGDAMVR